MRKVCAIAFVVLLAALSITVLPDNAEAYIPHAPISINSNAAFTAPNGVTGGSGTPGDPYIIEGWEIDATGTVGIRIMNTDVPFIIRDVYIHSDGANDSADMFLGWLQDGRVENVTLTDNKDALSLLITHNVTVMDSRISGENMGLHLDRADNTTLVNNTITPTSRYGFRFTQSENVTMSGNTITSDGIWIQEYGDAPSLYNSHTITTDNLVNGKPLYYYSNCNGVDIDGIPVGQLIVANCTDVRVANVTITDTSDAIQMFYASNVAVSNTTISAHHFGAAVFFSADIALTGMNIHDTGWGAYVGASDAVSFINSTFTSTSEAGLYFGGTGNGTIEGNEFVSSGAMLGLTPEQHDTLSIQDNTVNGKPLLYYKDCNDVDIDGIPVGQLIMVDCDDVRVANVDASDTTLGISIARASGVIVSDSVVTHGTRGGMVITNSDDILLSGNTVASCGQNGMYVSAATDVVISGNQVVGSYYDGLRAGSMDRVIIAGNDFSYNGWNGVYTNNPTNVTITGNVLSHNNKSGLFGQHDGCGE
jgi:parallel beta-helix repeat protein